LTWSKLLFLCTFILFYGCVKATLWRWLQLESQQQHYRTNHNQKQPKKKTAGEKMEADLPIICTAMAMSMVRIIDFDREESSNLNEACLNNSLNVSFLAFQIACAVKPDFFLLASSQRTFCIQGA
jgi:hypothetical protein